MLILLEILLYIVCGMTVSVLWKIYICRLAKPKKYPFILLMLLVLTCLAMNGLIDLAYKVVYIPIDILATEGGDIYNLLDGFIAAALVEESLKFVFLLILTWGRRSFDFSFDGIVFAAFVSLSYSGYENFFYIVESGISIALLRALFSTAAHLLFSLFMGIFYSRARYCKNMGDVAGMLKNFALALLVPIILHGSYDFFIDYSILLFVAYVVPMYPCIFYVLKYNASHNRPLSDADVIDR